MTYPFLLAAIEIDDSNDNILLQEFGSTAVATIAHGTYYLDPNGADWIGTAVATALSNAFAGGNSYSVTMSKYPDVGVGTNATITVTRTAGATSFRVRWLDASTTFDPRVLGFAVEKSVTDADPEASTKSLRALWVSSAVHRIVLPRMRWLGVAREDRADGGAVVTRGGERQESMAIEIELLRGDRVFAHESSDVDQALESFLDYALDGRPIIAMASDLLSGTTTDIGDDFRLLTASASGELWVLDEDMAEMDPASARTGLSLWDLTISLTRYRP